MTVFETQNRLGYWRQQFHKRLAALTERDRIALGILTLFLALVVLIYGFWLPATEHHTQAREYWQQQRDLLTWLQRQKPLISSNGGTGAVVADTVQASGQPLISRVNATAKAHQLSLKRLQPEGEKRLRLWMESVEFNGAIVWLEALRREQQLVIDDIAIDSGQQNNGRVDIRLVLSANGQ